MPRMLVKVDVSEGLPAKLEATWEGGSFTQKLDYSKLSFRWHNCHEPIHIRDRFPNPRFGFVIVEDPLSSKEEHDVLEVGLNSLIPLDNSLTLDLLGKFCLQLPILSKFLSLGFISSS